MPPLDPFTIEKLPIQLNRITITFHKGTVSGFLKTAWLIMLRLIYTRDILNSKSTGNITVKGRLMLFQIDGSGDSQIDLTNVKVMLHANTTYFKDEQGLQHWAIRNYTYDFDYSDNVHFQIKKLFRESKEWS